MMNGKPRRGRLSLLAPEVADYTRTRGFLPLCALLDERASYDKVSDSAMKPHTLTAADFRRAMGQFVTGVTIVTVEHHPPSRERQVRGMTANSFTSVSLKPPLILICVDECAKILPLLSQSRRFGVSVLTPEQEALSEYFASGEQSRERESRLGIRYFWTESGIPVIENTLAQFGCRVAATHAAGDHTIFVGKVESASLRAGEPLLFYRGKYRRVSGES
jgi:flavin reductase (DIM6/NTAB) family NADH-FMN oxidoreductase RutF